jgi:hypothetical protein
MSSLDYDKIIKDIIQKSGTNNIKQLPENINILLTGGGLASFYQIGILKYLDTLIYEEIIKTKINKIYSVSGGALIGALYVSGVDMNIFSKEYNNIKSMKSNRKLTDIAKDMLYTHLPEDSHIKCSNRLNIFVYEIESYKSHIRKVINKFESKDDLINIILASCTVSYITHEKFTYEHKNKNYVDGIDIDMQLVHDANILYESNENQYVLNLLIDLEYLEYKQKQKYTFTDECIDLLLIKSIYDIEGFMFNKDIKTIKLLDKNQIYIGQTLYYKIFLWTMEYLFK